nr:hypothetical protein GCM10020063_102230 [Dactylosporangium thailandense]
MNTRSNANGKREVPEYSAEMPDGSVVKARFDTAYGDEAIDRKLSLAPTPKSRRQAERQSVVAHFHGVQAVYERPWMTGPKGGGGRSPTNP